jgi:hypothetical protein
MFLSPVKFTTETKGEKEMKTIANIIMGLTFFNSILLGSGGSPPPPPLFSARNVNAVYEPPLNLAGENQSVIFAQLSSTVVSEVDGKINLDGTNTISDGLKDGKNFKWETPVINFRAGVYPAISKYTSLIIALGLDNAGGGLNISNFDLGINHILTIYDNHSCKLGYGINIRHKDFYWIQSSQGFEKNEAGIDYDPFIHLTYNTNFDDWFVNPFVQCSYSRQTLLDIDHYGHEVSFGVNVYTVTPGLSYNWDGDKLISLGLTFTNITGIENSRNFVFTPLLQFSYLFSNRE